MYSRYGLRTVLPGAFITFIISFPGMSADVRAKSPYPPTASHAP